MVKLVNLLKILQPQQLKNQKKTTQISELNTLYKQKLCLALGKYGCYFSCLVKIAEKITQKNIDILEVFNYCSKQKVNQDPWITDDCYIYYPEKILSYLCNKSVSILKTEDTDVDLTLYDFVIGCYKLSGSHFVLMNKKNEVIYDPLENSNSVKTGKLSSYRLVTIND